MKNFLIILVVITLTSATTTISTLSKRSKEQIVLHNKDLIALTKVINSYYALGYRVIHITNQSVATSVNSRNMMGSYNEPFRDTKGEILVIM